MNPEYAEHIRRLVDEAPPLSDQTMNRLKALLQPALKAVAERKPAPVRRGRAA